ncbi:hypothetical protein WA158_001285 [Blastocystis sp. Blastoise]
MNNEMEIEIESENTNNTNTNSNQINSSNSNTSNNDTQSERESYINNSNNNRSNTHSNTHSNNNSNTHSNTHSNNNTHNNNRYNRNRNNNYHSNNNNNRFNYNINDENELNEELINSEIQYYKKVSKLLNECIQSINTFTSQISMNNNNSISIQSSINIFIGKLVEIYEMNTEEPILGTILENLNISNINESINIMNIDLWNDSKNSLNHFYDNSKRMIEDLLKNKENIKNHREASKIRKDFEINSKSTLRSQIWNNNTGEHCTIPPDTLTQLYSDLYSSHESNTNSTSTSPPLWLSSNISTIPENSSSFNIIKFKDVTRILRKLPNNSTPGANGIPYEIYKRSTSARLLLTYILEVCRYNEITLNSWNESITWLLDKGKDDKSSLNNWRPLCLQNVESKIFSSLIVDYINNINNSYHIISSYQKGFTPNVAGCEDLNYILSNIIADFLYIKGISKHKIVLI